MNNLERLKRAEESEPMAVLVVDKIPTCCYNCGMLYIGVIAADGYQRWACWATQDETGFKDLSEVDKLKPDWCPLQPAIGIITPGGHVRYFVEEKNDSTRSDGLSEGHRGQI